MIVVLAEVSMIPGRRIELVAAFDEAGRLLAAHGGFLAARLLHFAGGGYRYLYEMSFRDRTDWDEFFAGPGLRALRELIEPQLTVPFGVQVHAVISEYRAE